MQNITATEVKERLEKGEKLNLVDVREPAENAEFNIGGILLPLGQIVGMELEPIEDLKDEEVILYCRSGNRSGQACMYLEMNGFTNVKNLAGGMNEWRGI
jgi:rhodanese-related sulfurtransferase